MILTDIRLLRNDKVDTFNVLCALDWLLNNWDAVVIECNAFSFLIERGEEILAFKSIHSL